MIGSDGARRRTCFATRWVKSGLSMMTRRSGLAATTASIAMPPAPAEADPLRPEAGLQRPHQLGAELVAGFLARDDPHRDGLSGLHGHPSTGGRRRRGTGRARRLP